MTNKEFLLKLVEARTPIWLDWEDNTTVIIGDSDDVSYKSKVIFDEDGNAISVEKVLEDWEKRGPKSDSEKSYWDIWNEKYNNG